MIEAVIFDLDGVIVSTDEYHYLAWKRLADEEGIYFDRDINQRLRGVSRMGSLEIILERASVPYTQEKKIKLTERKNGYYREYLNHLSGKDILPGVMDWLGGLGQEGIPTAIGSSSKNTLFILDKIGLRRHFDAIVGGQDVAKTKPDPEIFLLAARKLNKRPESCLVVEDAAAGVEAAVEGRMKVLAVGFAQSDRRADFSADNLSMLPFSNVLSLT